MSFKLLPLRIKAGPSPLHSIKSREQTGALSLVVASAVEQCVVFGTLMDRNGRFNIAKTAVQSFVAASRCNLDQVWNRPRELLTRALASRPDST